MDHRELDALKRHEAITDFGVRARIELTAFYVSEEVIHGVKLASP